MNKNHSGKLHAHHISVREALKTMPKAAVKSIVKEVLNVWGIGKHMHPVSLRHLTMRQRKSFIRSRLVLKDKYSPTGEFEKLKIGLVSLGDMQDANLHSEEETTSSTVSLLAV